MRCLGTTIEVVQRFAELTESAGVVHTLAELMWTESGVAQSTEQRGMFALELMHTESGVVHTLAESMQTAWVGQSTERFAPETFGPFDLGSVPWTSSIVLALVDMRTFARLDRIVLEKTQ